MTTYKKAHGINIKSYDEDPDNEFGGDNDGGYYITQNK